MKLTLRLAPLLGWILFCLGMPNVAQADRSIQSLNGPWEFRREE